MMMGEGGIDERTRTRLQPTTYIIVRVGCGARPKHRKNTNVEKSTYTKKMEMVTTTTDRQTDR